MTYFQHVLQLRDEDSFLVFQGDTKTSYLNEQLAAIDGMVPVEANVFLSTLLLAWHSGDTRQMPGMADFIEENKTKYGGTLRLMKTLLHTDAHSVFRYEMMYSDI